MAMELERSLSSVLLMPLILDYRIVREIVFLWMSICAQEHFFLGLYSDSRLSWIYIKYWLAECQFLVPIYTFLSLLLILHELLLAVLY